MKHNVNFFLFGIIILLLFAMIGMALYFNTTYAGLSLRYNKAMDNIKNLTYQLNETLKEVNEKNLELMKKEKTLIDIVNELNLSKQKISSLGEFYTQEKGVREELEMDLEKVREERDFWKLNYTQTKQDLELWKKNYLIKVQELNRATSRISLLSSVVDNIEKEVSGSEGIDEIESEIEEVIDIIEYDLDGLEDIIDDVRGEDVKDELDDKAQEIKESIETLKSKINKLRTKINEIKSSLERV